MRFIQLTITAFAVASRLVALAIANPIPNGKHQAGGIAIPLTRHSSFPNSNTSIDIRDVVSSHGISVDEKILSGLDNYEMNTGRMHPFAVKRSESGLGTRGVSVPLINYQNLIWSGEISIGTPPKTLMVSIDTGSTDTWVLQIDCSGLSGGRDSWDPNSSKSAKDQAQQFRFKYGDGTIVKGDRYTDNVTIGGFTADPQTFGSVTSYTSEKLAKTYYSDGLLGLAFPSVSKFHANPLIVSLFVQERINNLMFSLRLASSGAEIYIGGANSMLYRGNIAYTRVTEPGFWQVSMDDIRVNSIPILKNVPAIFDTGASYIFGDWDKVAQLYGHIGGGLVSHKGYGFYYLRCDSFPTIGFTFGGKTFAIPPEVLILQPLALDPSYCFSTILARRSAYGFWSIGVPFLQSVYSVFDYTGLQIGLAELA